MAMDMPPRTAITESIMSVRGTWQLVLQVALQNCFTSTSLAKRRLILQHRHSPMKAQSQQMLLNVSARIGEIGHAVLASSANKPTQEHTRHHIDCKYPLHESIEWSCEACKRNWPSAHPNFTLEADKFRWFHGKTRIGTKRRRRHSRDPRPTASAGSSASLRTDQLLPDEADLEGAQGQQQSTASSSDALDYQHAQATARLPRQATADSHDGGKHARRDNAGI